MNLKSLLLSSTSLLILAACSSQPPVFQSSQSDGLLLLEGASNHGEKLWYADSIRIKSEQWNHGQKHGLSVEVDGSRKECLNYTRFNKGKESGTDISDNCTEKVSDIQVQRSFETDDQVMLNYDELLHDWVLDLKGQSASKLESSTLDDHAFEMGLRAGLKDQLQSFLQMDVEKPEWHRILRSFQVGSFKLGAFKASEEFPVSKSGDAFNHKVVEFMAQAGYPSGSDVNAFSWGFLLGEYSARKALGEAVLIKDAWVKSNLFQVQFYEAILQGSHLPKKNGEWTGTPGNSYWMSFREEVLSLTQGEGILFYQNMPAVSSWSLVGVLVSLEPEAVTAESRLLTAVEGRYQWDAEMLQAKSAEQSLSLVNLGQGRYELIPDVLKDEIQPLQQGLSSK